MNMWRSILPRLVKQQPMLLDQILRKLGLKVSNFGHHWLKRKSKERGRMGS